MWSFARCLPLTAILMTTPAACATAPGAVPGPQATQPAPTPGGTGAITVELDDLRNERGQVLVSVFRQAEGFPDRPERAFARGRTPIHGGQARFHVEPVPEGAFAVAVHHDEDEDLTMATGFMGIPAEGYGFSRDATGSFGPPSFEAARLWLQPGQSQHVRIRMRY